jgi:formylmethanofuran dehydrogenase subunit E
MIVDKKIKINITTRNITYFKNKGYKVEIFNMLEINVKDLPSKSNIKIKAKCDKCGKERSVIYKNYMNYLKNNNNLYLCKICSHEKY